MRSRASSRLLPLMIGLCAVACGDDGPTSMDASSSIDAASPGDADRVGDGRSLGVACQALGGSCVPGRWASCPAGLEPTEDVHSDCKPETAARGYFCCVPAPESTCSEAEFANCFAGGCHACWDGVDESENLACEDGRVCCAYTCLD